MEDFDGINLAVKLLVGLIEQDWRKGPNSVLFTLGRGRIFVETEYTCIPFKSSKTTKDMNIHTA
jgi:hypothetical protein